MLISYTVCYIELIMYEGKTVDFGDKKDVRYDLRHIHISDIENAYDRSTIRAMYEKMKSNSIQR